MRAWVCVEGKNEWRIKHCICICILMAFFGMVGVVGRRFKLSLPSLTRLDWSFTVVRVCVFGDLHVGI